MQSKIKGETKVQKSEYPCLKVSRSDVSEREQVVLFTDPNEGFVVYSTDLERQVGDYSKSWVEYNFEPFNGTIELSN